MISISEAIVRQMMSVASIVEQGDTTGLLEGENVGEDRVYDGKR
ncbi:MAG: hypothetical protein R2772_00360 [Chitinophagales bacterium]